MSTNNKFDKLNKALQDHAEAMHLPVFKGFEETSGRRSESAKITMENKTDARNASSRSAFNEAHPDMPKTPSAPAKPKAPAQPIKQKPMPPMMQLGHLKPFNSGRK
ncbi:TPA: hypothetical protein DCG61_01365 [Patescibacteria group bacterium]|nr:hypothetical protein [Patescibacteria group bacterium]